MEDLEDSAKAYGEIGKELDAKVIPVGLAWQQVTFQQPTLNLYDTDGGHPNIKGTFLNLPCTILRFLGHQFIAPSINLSH